MRKRILERIPWLARVLIVVGLVLLADRLLWPRYSRERRIDPDAVVLAVLPNAGYEVHRDKEPRLLRRLVRALSGARSWMRWGVDWEQYIILHFRRGPSLAIRYGQLKHGGAFYFWGQRSDRYRDRRLYRAAALGKVLEAISASEECRMKPVRIPPDSLSRIVCYTADFHRTLPGSSPAARRLLDAVNGFLGFVHTSCYESPYDQTAQLLYEGQAQPESYLKGTTGALLILDPPLPMHTTVISSYFPPLIEYHQFKTSRILISDAISLYRLKPVGFSSTEKNNRFYLFHAAAPPGAANKDLPEKTWSKVTQAIERAVLEPGTSPR